MGIKGCFAEGELPIVDPRKHHDEGSPNKLGSKYPYMVLRLEQENEIKVVSTFSWTTFENGTIEYIDDEGEYKIDDQSLILVSHTFSLEIRLRYYSEGGRYYVELLEHKVKHNGDIVQLRLHAIVLNPDGPNPTIYIHSSNSPTFFVRFPLFNFDLID